MEYSLTEWTILSFFLDKSFKPVVSCIPDFWARFLNMYSSRLNYFIVSHYIYPSPPFVLSLYAGETVDGTFGEFFKWIWTSTQQCQIYRTVCSSLDNENSYRVCAVYWVNNFGLKAKMSYIFSQFVPLCLSTRSQIPRLVFNSIVFNIQHIWNFTRLLLGVSRCLHL